MNLYVIAFLARETGELLGYLPACGGAAAGSPSKARKFRTMAEAVIAIEALGPPWAGAATRAEPATIDADERTGPGAGAQDNGRAA